MATSELVGGTTTIKYQHADVQGTPLVVTNAAKATLETSEYEPYGRLANRTLSDGPGYTGHVQDAATGLTYMQQRYYDPLLGRFLSVDPVVASTSNGGNFNRYAYTDNNPYRYVDPEGESKTIATLIKLTANGVRKIARLTKEQAVRARRQGQNVHGDRQQVSQH